MARSAQILRDGGGASSLEKCCVAGRIIGFYRQVFWTTHGRSYNKEVNLDDKVCYCYHVSLRKLVNFARRERPQRASQMSQCLGAGTGCGWCIPILKKIFEESRSTVADEPAALSDLPETAEQYAESRRVYLGTEQKNTF